jgi:hypothetical protein
MTTEELVHEDADDKDTGVFFNPLTAVYYYDPKLDIEYAVIDNAIDCDHHQMFADGTFDIVAQRELESGCRLAIH